MKRSGEAQARLWRSRARC